MFGAFHVVGKALLGELPPLAVAGLRVAIATPLLLAVAAWKDRYLPTWTDLRSLALLGFLGVFANQLLFIVGLSYTTASNAAILMPSIPVFAAALGALLGIQRLDRRQLAGIASAVAGAVVLLDPTRFSLSDDTVFGNLLILINCGFYSAFLVLQRPVLQRLPWRTVIAWSFLLGGAGVLAVSSPELAALAGRGVAPTSGLGVAYIALFPTTLGYFLATWSVRRSSPTLVAAYTTLQPLASALLAAAFLGERVGWRQAVGFALITGGLFGVSRRR
jgi:drug/metabolite transporter (DMT)-like permease